MANLTLEVTIPEAAISRVAAAYQRALGTPAPATKAEIEAALKARIRSLVARAEREAAAESVPPPPDLEV